MATEHAIITWRHELPTALEDARQRQRNVLVDFSAAPM
jgi:hypothetical protein